MSGWGYRSSSSGVPSATTGTTSLSIPKPSGTILNDILIMCLMHKGLAYATVPAGWNLVDQNISGVTRGEMYWKRATGSEPTNYAVTGLADIAVGGILCYTGGLLSGDIVHVKASRANAVGAIGPGACNPTISDCLAINMIAKASSKFTHSLIVHIADDGDYSTGTRGKWRTPPSKINQDTTTGTDGGLVVAQYSINLPFPEITDYSWNVNPVDFQNVCIVAHFIHEPLVTTGPARYYLSARKPTVVLEEQLKGIWNNSYDGLSIRGVQHRIGQLSRTKTAEGNVYNPIITSNLKPSSSLLSRYLTPILSAQTLSNYTFTVCSQVKAIFKTLTGNLTTQVRFKVHAYVTVGDSALVRTVILDNQISAVNWPSSTLGKQHVFTLPSTVDIQEGDRIMIEYGSYVVDAPDSPPIKPTQSNYSEMTMQYGCTENATIGGGNGPNAVGTIGAADAVDGIFISSGSTAAWFQFSGPITEAAIPLLPELPNITCATAIVITEIPYKSGYVNTTQVNNMSRQIWYKWTCDVDQEMIFHTFGSEVSTEVEVYSDKWDPGACGAWPSYAQLEYEEWNYLPGFNLAGSISCANFWAKAGRTYWFSIFYYTSNGIPQAAGGLVQFELCKKEVFQAGDIFYPCDGILTAWRNGQLVGLCWEMISAGALAGIAIDYTKQPLTDVYDPAEIYPIHTEHRILLSIFDNSSLVVFIMDLQSFNPQRNVLDYIYDAFDPACFNGSTLEINVNGVLFQGSFGDGFHLVGGGQASFENAISTISACKVNKLPANAGDDQPVAPFPIATTYPLELEKGGTDYIRLRNTVGTLAYVSAGQYIELDATRVMQYNTVTNSQTSDPVPVAKPGVGPIKSLKGIQPLKDGGILVCHGSVVQRYSAGGVWLRDYAPTPAKLAVELTDVNLDIDNAHFWVVCGTNTTFFRFNLATGEQVSSFSTSLIRGTGIAFVIYNPDRFVVPPDGGIYYIHPDKNQHHDSYYVDVEKKIPNPTAKIALFGD